MKRSLLPYLSSPADGSQLFLEASESRDEEVLTGQLIDSSGNRYPIVQGIPFFAQSESADETFAFKWKMIGQSYGYEEKSRAIRQQWYLDRFGFKTRDRLSSFLRDKRLVLDAGTGSGVDAAMFAESGVTVFAIDLSQEAAYATHRHLGHLPNVHVIQGNLQNLPFPNSMFDYVSCDQVLHHTPDPSKSFAELVRCLCLGGLLAVYVYRRKGPIREFVDDYIRGHMVNASPETCFEVCRSLTLLGKALAELNVKVDISSDIPLLGIKSGSYDIQRFIYWNVMKCYWNPDYDLTTNIAINFDWYHPRYAFRYTVEEIRAWFGSYGFSVMNFSEIESGISVLGQLPRANR